MKNFFCFLLIFFLISCSSKKDILYFNNSEEYAESQLDFQEHIISIDDILKISITSDNALATLDLDPKFNPVNSNSTIESLKLEGFIVDSNGEIFIPSIGGLKVIGLTKVELRKLIINKIIDGNLLMNPNVDVKILNQHFTILGEVNRPGRYEYINNNITILEAIGMAGDLTITGKRDNVIIVRNDNGFKKANSIDLTDINTLSSNFFQIISGDVIIVNPNSTRVKNAGIIGNSGTLLSLLSFILSSIIVITNR